MIMAIYLFKDSYIQVVTITFTGLILSEVLNVYTELHKLHPMMIASAVGTLVVYFTSIVLLREYINVDYIDTTFLVTILMIVSISWLPLHIIKCVLNAIDPTDYQKIMKRI